MYYVRARSIQAVVEAEPVKHAVPVDAVALTSSGLPPKADAGAATALRDVRILLAEDNEFNAMVAQGHLEDWLPGARLTHVLNGAEALEAVRNSSFDVVLMDIQMPEMNGYDAAKAIRALTGDRSHIPIIAMSANVMKAEIDRCREAGMNAFVPKPYKKEQLMQAIEGCMASAERGRA
ncbi:MAG: response regulator [Flavobacteriales bacterium]|nr:response regulator [Flavobacteriales bacterium]